MADPTLPQARCDFYVYVIFRLDGRPCYVGKGHGRRWKDHDRGATNPYLRRIIAQSDGPLPITKVREGLPEAEALATEIALIAAIGRVINGGPLVNLTDGGEGSSGYQHKPESKGKTSAALRGRPKSPEHVANMKANHKGFSGGSHTLSARAKIAISLKGYQKSPEHKENLRIAGIGYKHPPERVLKNSISHKGMIISLETRAKMSASRIGRSASAETRLKISIAAKAREARRRDARSASG